MNSSIIILMLKPFVRNRDDFYNAILSNGLTPKETLDNVIYNGIKQPRGSYYCYFANRV